MIDHLTVRVSNLAQSEAFYGKALEAIGYKNVGNYGGAVGFAPDGDVNRGSLWVAEGDYVTKGMHVGFFVDTHEVVQRFYKEAMRAGGKSDGEPGSRPEYGGNYYAAFVLDPDGNSIEACFYEGKKK